jgi:hypothetical protein
MPMVFSPDSAAWAAPRLRGVLLLTIIAMLTAA